VVSNGTVIQNYMNDSTCTILTTIFLMKLLDFLPLTVLKRTDGDNSFTGWMPFLPPNQTKLWC